MKTIAALLTGLGIVALSSPAFSQAANPEPGCQRDRFFVTATQWDFFPNICETEECRSLAEGAGIEPDSRGVREIYAVAYVKCSSEASWNDLNRGAHRSLCQKAAQGKVEFVKADGSLVATTTPDSKQTNVKKICIPCEDRYPHVEIRLHNADGVFWETQDSCLKK